MTNENQEKIWLKLDPSCRELAEQFLPLYVGHPETLEKKERTTLESHIKKCGNCQKLYGELRKIRDDIYLNRENIYLNRESTSVKENAEKAAEKFDLLKMAYLDIKAYFLEKKIAQFKRKLKGEVILY